MKHMKMPKYLLALAILTICLMSTLLNAGVSAAKTGTLTISPFLKELKLTENDVSNDFQLTITNNTAKTQEFTLSALDFGSLNQTGGIVFAGSNSNSLINKYGLANWLELGVNSLTLEPGQSKSIPVSIINDVTLRPGGHYAAVVSSVTNQETPDVNEISINQKLSTLIFLTKTGGEKYDLKLKKIVTSGGTFKLPNIVTLHFNNPGNVHVIPRGTVKLISLSGKVISQGIINEDSSFALPETNRQIVVDLKNISSAGLLPSIYKVQVNYRYDGIERFARREQTIKYVNIPLIILILTVLSVVSAVLYKLRHKIKKLIHK